LTPRAIRWLAGLAAVPVLLIGVGVSPASAAKDPDAYRDHWTDRYDCEIGQLVEKGSRDGRLTIKDTSADGQAFLALAVDHFELAMRVKGSDVRFTIFMDIVYDEKSMREVAADDPRLDGIEVIGPVYEFIATQTTTVVVRTGDGTVLSEYTESGVETDFVDLFDTLGDFAPGGEYLGGEQSGDLPVLFTADFCDVAEEAAAA
jgi:hypothetical protein